MFIIPMAGLSARFFNAGYKIPKYMLKVGSNSVFETSIRSFEKYFEKDLFVFIIRDVYETNTFIEDVIAKCNIKKYRVVTLARETSGQAETVALGLDSIESDLKNEELYVFNIDTFRPGFEKGIWRNMPDGYLETFIGSGTNWSNVEPLGEGSDLVKRTAEKEEISQYCCTGLYFWKTAQLFLKCFNETYKEKKWPHRQAETYIAPMYNVLIENKGEVRFNIISKDNVIFCGTPEEYLKCCATMKNSAC